MSKRKRITGRVIEGSFRVDIILCVRDQHRKVGVKTPDGEKQLSKKSFAKNNGNRPIIKRKIHYIW